DFSGGPVANVGFKSGTRIIELLVSFSIPKFAQRSLRMLANFGIGTLALAGMVPVIGAAAHAQDMRVDRLEIVESGFYDSTTATVTGTTPSAGTVTGTVQQLRDVTLASEPPATGARVGAGSVGPFPPFPPPPRAPP